MNFTSTTEALGTDNLQSEATQRYPVGTRAETRDGRVFRYALAGASDLVAGNLLQGPAIVANHLALTAAAQSIGDTTITVTPGATAGAANLYAAGWLNVDTTPGNGRLMGISGHGAITSSTAFSLYLVKDDAVGVAFTTATRYGLIPSPWNGVIAMPTTATGSVAGVAQYVITAGQYGWVQTWGMSSLLINGTPGINIAVVNGATTAGSVDVITTTNLVTSRIVGNMAQVGVSGKNNAVMLTLYP